MGFLVRMQSQKEYKSGYLKSCARECLENSLLGNQFNSHSHNHKWRRDCDSNHLMPSRAEPSWTEPSRAEPSWTEPSRAEPSWTEPSRAEPSRAEPSRAECNITQKGEGMRMWIGAGKGARCMPIHPGNGGVLIIFVD